MGDRYYSTSSAFLEALAEAGIRYMFANLGSDHPGLIEALAQARAEERRAELPELFGVPSSAQWVARRYGTPALSVIYNNRGWKAPKMSALAVHPKGAAAEADDFNVSFEPAADLPGVAAAAGGAFAANVTDPAGLPGVLTDALAAVHSGRSAVVAAHLPGV